MTVVEAARPAEAVEADALRRNIEAHVAGNVSGQLAIGDRNIQVTAAEGAVVVVGGAPPAPPRRRPVPVQLGPRDFPGLLGREAELASATSALGGSSHVLEVHAGPGWGKSALLRRACHIASVPPDGLVYLPCGGLAAEDIEQLLFDAFYESALPVKPSSVEVRRLLAGVSALIVLDDAELDRPGAERILDVAPRCAVVVVDAQPVLAGEAASLALHGLSQESGIALFERELGRGVEGRDRQAVESIWAAVGGQPLALVQAAALARDEGRSLAAVARSLGGGQAPAELAAQRLPDGERQVLGLLAGLGGPPLSASAVGAILGAQAGDSLVRLESRGLVIRRGSGFAAAPLSPQALAGLGEVGAPEAGLRRLAAWAAATAAAPAELLDNAEALQRGAEAAQRLELWPEVRALVRALAPAVALAGRWQAWAALLGAGLAAAQATGSAVDQAWCLHQLGVLETGLGNLPAAAAHLRAGRQLARQSGARRTEQLARQNLRLLRPAHKLAIAAGAAGVAALSLGLAAWALPVPGAAALQPESADFGPVRVANTAEHQLSVSNRGYLSVGLRSITADGDFTAASDCPLAPDSLAGRAACTVTVRFRPSAVGDLQGHLVVTETGGGVRTADLGGRGIAPLLAVSPLRIDFPNTPVGRSTDPTTLAVENRGEAVLQLQSPSVTGDFRVSSDCPPAAPGLGPAERCAVRVTFAPTAAGKRAGALVLRGDGGISATIPLAGVGTIGRPVLQPSAIDFGNQSVLLPSAAREAVLSNAGDADLPISQIAATGDFLATSKCGSVLAPGLSCPVTVTFTPKAGGSRQGVLSVFQPDRTSVAIKLAGNGLYPSPRLTIPVVDKSLAIPGLVVQVTNGGPGKLQVTGAQLTGDPSLVVSVNTCLQGPVDPGKYCQVGIIVSPSAAPSRTIAVTQLTVFDNAADGKQSITLNPPPTPSPSPPPIA